MYHEPTVAEMARQSDGWAWAVCTICGHRGAIRLTIPARTMPAGTGILALAARLRCARGHRRCVIAKPISAGGEEHWDSPPIELEHPADAEDHLSQHERAARADPEAYATWQRLSRMRWHVGIDVTWAGAIRDIGYFLSRVKSGLPFDWSYARRALNQVIGRTHYLIDAAAKAQAAELDQALRALGESDSDRLKAEASTAWAIDDAPDPRGMPWKRRDH